MDKYTKVYDKINWQNKPSTATPLDATNLGKVDRALDVVDDRVIELQELVGEGSGKSISYAEWLALPEAERNKGEYFIPDFPLGITAAQVNEIAEKNKSDITEINSNLTNQEKSIGASGKCKNILNCTIGTAKSNNVTCTNNGDGTFTLNGTASGNCYFLLAEEFVNLDLSKSYRIVGCPANGSNNSYFLFDNNSSSISRDYGEGVIYNPSAQPKIYISVRSGTTCNNLIFKPMLVDSTLYPNVTYDDFVPYTGKGNTLMADVAEINGSLKPTSKKSIGVVSNNKYIVVEIPIGVKTCTITKINCVGVGELSLSIISWSSIDSAGYYYALFNTTQYNGYLIEFFMNLTY